MKKPKALRQEIFDQWSKKHRLIFEHIYHCLAVGSSIPLIRVRWDKRKDDLVIELVGQAR